MAAQIELPEITKQMEVRQPTVMGLMQIALETGKVEQLQILQDMHFKQQAREAEIEFNQAMNAIQAEIGRVRPDLLNPQTSSKYASYQALDKEIRPIYTRNGMSLSFSEEDCPKPDHVRIICYVSKGLHTRVYRKDMPVDNKGIKGTVMMTPTHATASADSYGRRYLLKDIFNIAIGEGDNDGNGEEGYFDSLSERLEWIANSKDLNELKRIYDAAYADAKKARDGQAMLRIIKAKDARKAELS